MLGTRLGHVDPSAKSRKCCCEQAVRSCRKLLGMEIEVVQLSIGGTAGIAVGGTLRLDHHRVRHHELPLEVAVFCKGDRLLSHDE